MVFLCSTWKYPSAQKIKTVLTKHLFVGPAYQGKDIVFRFFSFFKGLRNLGLQDFGVLSVCSFLGFKDLGLIVSLVFFKFKIRV
jgi:hypothetical protein